MWEKEEHAPGNKTTLVPERSKKVLFVCVKGRLQWLQALNITYKSESQAVCTDHFDSKWHACKGRLLNNAVPNSVDGCDEQGTDTYQDWQEDIDAPKMGNTDVISEELPFNYKYDVSFGEINSTRDTADSLIRVPSPVEATLHNVTHGGDHSNMNHQEPHTTASSLPASSLTPEDLDAGDHESDPEDTEYSSDDDLAFWQKMKRHAKQRNKKLYRKKFFHKYSQDQSNSRNSPVNSQIDQNLRSTREDNETSNKVSSVVKRSGNDDWITDDEDDDDDHENIDLAFKREWEEKRLPHNSKEKNFVCSICGKAYSKPSFLRAHIVRNHKEHEEAKRYPHFCPHCRKVYVREKDLMKHQQQFSGPCEICGVVLGCSDLFWAHRRDHDSVCKVCNKEFTKMSSLYIHMKIEHSKNPLSCSVCDKRFHCESLLKKHFTNIHDNLTVRKTITKCDKCDFSAKTQRALRIHQGLVHGLKPDLFPCKKCKKTFSTQVTYKNHIATHRKRSIICPLCSEKFTSEDELQTHRISVHEVSDSVGSGKETLSSHLDSSHLSQYACALCNITLGSNEDMSQHMHKYHDMDIDSPREIRLQIERVHLSEIDKNAKGVWVVGSEETYPQELDKPTTRDLSTHFGSSSDKSSLLVPASAMPPNVNVVEVIGVQYHVVREDQQH
ncbi:zinc finger protein 765-like isoform X2 [Portunus trituberculatus]|uniref:zinc finger protein 765-like isoform X2 n=1 Tax=Portunus trituberculatus TaxID=210409 RepID=UPI001E1CBE19|nr:zinc finger protein 765-like isoform X2 [Portunus trituberculatus]